VQSKFPGTSTISFALICLTVIDNREICNATKINLFSVKIIFQAVVHKQNLIPLQKNSKSALLILHRDILST
jgi:hypothetical protein